LRRQFLNGASRGASAEPTPAEARDFVARAETELAADSEYLNRALWVQETYINSDTNWLVAKANAAITDRTVGYAKQAVWFDHVKQLPDAERAVALKFGDHVV
jgi:peptidyl-dipeptidase A